jgi:glycosyltransferase involved in cell wall biosynthesis
MKISAAIITFNEERNISRAIESLRCCDEIVVVDSGSTDRTVELAVKHGSRVIDILLKCSDSELRVKCKRFESRDRYTTLAAEQLVAQQDASRLDPLAIDPPWTFFKTYALQRGFLDGAEGPGATFLRQTSTPRSKRNAGIRWRAAAILPGFRHEPL